MPTISIDSRSLLRVVFLFFSSNGLVAAIVFSQLDLKLVKYNKIFSSNVLNHLCKIATVFVPAKELLVLIIQVYSKGSDEPAHVLSLISAFAAHLHRVWN